MSAPTTEVEGLLTDDQRRVTIKDHAAFRDSIEAPAPVGDSLDELIEEIRAAEFEERGSER